MFSQVFRLTAALAVCWFASCSNSSSEAPDPGSAPAGAEAATSALASRPAEATAAAAQKPAADLAPSPLPKWVETVLGGRKISFSVEDEDEGTGVYRLSASAVDGGQALEITEQLEIAYPEKPEKRIGSKAGKRLAFKSTVRYSLEPEYEPILATVETTINGQVCMRGKVRFEDGILSYEGTALADREGNPLKKPESLSYQADRALDGIVLLPSAVPVLGPVLLKDVGRLDGVVSFQFPGDIRPPDLIEPAGANGLVREPDPDGDGFRLRLCRASSPDAALSCVYDRKGKLIALSYLGHVRSVREGG